MNKIGFYVLVTLFIAGCGTVQRSSQETDWIVSIDDSIKVSTDEFIYMLTKNQSDSSLTKEEIDEYLELYTNFKLKVLDARSSGYDTLESLQDEFETYKSQLLKPYMGFENINDSILYDAYERSRYEIKAQHLLLSTRNKEETEVLKQILAIRSRIQNGEDFSDMAKLYSEDPSAKVNAGDLGYFSAFRMVYPFEIAAYETPVGEVSQPVKTQFGYHIIKVTDRRKSRDQLKLAHILIRNTSDPKIAESRIEEIEGLLNDGEDWNETCKRYSEDPNSRNNGGVLPWISAGRTVPEFETAAYDLKEKGEVSDPVKTPYGWHIIKLLDRKGIPSFEESKEDIGRKLKRSGGENIDEEEILKRLKARFNFVRNDSVITKYLLDKEDIGDSWLFRLKGKSYTRNDLEENYYGTDEISISEYERFENEQVFLYEENRIISLHPEVKYLIQEYDEGLMLFEIMDDKVWRLAVEDSIGLQQYFEDNREEYKWNDRIEVASFKSIASELDSQIVDMGSELQWDRDSLKSIADQNDLIFEVYYIEKERDESWESIANSPKVNFIDSKTLLVQLSELRSDYKSIDEAKGEVIADFQDHLDDQWISQLRSIHTVNINDSEVAKIYDQRIR